MVVTRLMGGLGNQMFQYAAGRRLAFMLDTELKLDNSWFDGSNERVYSLAYFNIQECMATQEEVSTLNPRNSGILEKLVKKLRGVKSTYFHEKYFHFDPELLALPDGIYLDGYWQSEKYFIDIENILRQEFTIKFPQSGANRLLADQIADCESVSLHIRRGDYVSSPTTGKVHGVCRLDYYDRCVEQLVRNVDKPHFFIFSDEPEWARKNINITYPTVIVDHNKSDSYEDLRLMSQCKYHIIANSSFSWWAAWLDNKNSKVVFGPKQWFKSAEINTKDLIPDSWIQL